MTTKGVNACSMEIDVQGVRPTTKTKTTIKVRKAGVSKIGKVFQSVKISDNFETSVSSRKDWITWFSRLIA